MHVYVHIISSAQYVIQVFQRLQKLNLCMSHQVTSTLISTIGKDYDAKVHQWKQDVLVEVDSTVEAEVKAIHKCMQSSINTCMLFVQSNQLLLALYRMCGSAQEDQQSSDSDNEGESSACSSPDLVGVESSSEDEYQSPVMSDSDMDTDAVEGAACTNTITRSNY